MQGGLALAGPWLILRDGFQFAQVVKHAAKWHVVGVTPPGRPWHPGRYQRRS